MDSTHYDRRIFQNQCLVHRERKELPRERFWLIIRSIAAASATNTTEKNIVPLRRQLVTSSGEDRLVTRTSPNAMTDNRTITLGIDQAMIDIIVDKQVRFIHCATSIDIPLRSFWEICPYSFKLLNVSIVHTK